eukprot:scaffold1697_cov120-Cylindrotheca_fusiformis.AAC.55
MATEYGTTTSGILIFRSVRSHFASFTLIPAESNDAGKPSNGQIGCVEATLVRLQFADQFKELRSLFRREYKLGDIVEIKEGRWENINEKQQATEWVKPRLVIDFWSTEEASSHVHVLQSQYWKMPQCQAWQNRIFGKRGGRADKANNIGETQERNQLQETLSINQENFKNANHHAGGLGKRQQGEIIADFLIKCIMYKLSVPKSPCSQDEVPSNWREEFGKQRYSGLKMKAIEYLNSGTGVIDVAGGSGHVSMALGMAGVKSTVIDARSKIGKLPGRDRKVWNRALKRSRSTTKSLEDTVCQPVVPFDTSRAWFGSFPRGVDKSFRHPDEEELPICDEESDLIRSSSAIVALHPDEATGDTVCVAVQKRIPFVVVPCCVFCRLFPERRTHPDNQLVSSYEDLVEYLKQQDRTIQETKLPFEGKNTVLWSTF